MEQTNTLRKETYPLLGLHCTSCAARATETLRSLSGVESVDTNFALAQVSITYDRTKITPQEFADAIEAAGYHLVIAEQMQSPEEVAVLARAAYHRKQRQTIVALLLSSVVMVLGMAYMHIAWADWTSWLLTSMILIYSGQDFYHRAYKQVTSGGLGMDTLVALSTGIAYIYSSINLFFPSLLNSIGQTPHLYFEASSMIVAFVLLGKLLEERAKGNATEAIRGLMQLQPREVLRIDKSGNEHQCSIEEVVVGDLIIIRPGERIAIDGTVIRGSSSVDESMLTGESMPIPKAIDASVYAGTVSLDGTLVVRCDVDHRQTRLAHIIQTVNEAQSSRAPIQKFADRVAGYFVGAILLLSLLVAVIWLIIGGDDALGQALVSAITILVVSCPCALGLATPLAVIVGVGQAAKRGILIRDAESLEVAHSVRAVVLDKTGTLTTGQPKLNSQVWLTPPTDELRALVAALERRSQHPVSHALCKAFTEVIPNAEPTNWEYLAGQGVMAEYSNMKYLSGNKRLMSAHGIVLPTSIQIEIEKLEEHGESLTYFARGTELLAIFGVIDSLKATSARAVHELQAQGLSLHILTGDRKKVAESIANSVGITQVLAEVLPEEKGKYIQTLKGEGITVAMVGDGINDSAALALADLSIAMGNGSDIAMDNAMVTIMSSDLEKLPELILLSRKTMRIIRQNLFWAFSYNIIAIPLATGFLTPLLGWQMTPMLASAAMTLSSLTVVLNSLRLSYSLRSKTNNYH